MSTETPDMVNEPPHYRSHPSGVECIDIAESMSFCLGNAFKYLFRAGEKNDLVEDLKKAEWYLNREIKLRSWIDDTRMASRRTLLSPKQSRVVGHEKRFGGVMSRSFAHIFDAGVSDPSVNPVIKARNLVRVMITNVESSPA